MKYIHNIDEIVNKCFFNWIQPGRKKRGKSTPTRKDRLLTSMRKMDMTDEYWLDPKLIKNIELWVEDICGYTRTLIK